MSDAENILDRTIRELRTAIATADQCADMATDPVALDVALDEARADLAEWEDLRTAFAQAVDLAIRVDESAKGSLAAEAQRVMGTAHAKELRRRIDPRTVNVTGEVMIHGGAPVVLCIEESRNFGSKA